MILLPVGGVAVVVVVVAVVEAAVVAVDGMHVPVASDPVHRNQLGKWWQILPALPMWLEQSEIRSFKINSLKH